MALMQGRIERVDLPHEPGEWFEFRRLSAAQQRERKLLSIAALTVTVPDAATLDDREQADAARVAMALGWTKACVVGWSYDLPFSIEAVDLLDMRTLVWACFTAYARTHGIETDEEKKPDSVASIVISTETPEPSALTSG